MNQIIQEKVCGNKQYIHCEVENHKCVHCGKFHNVSEGDFVDSKCEECKKSGMIKVETAYTSGDFYGYCDKCRHLNEAISDVSGKFQGEWVYYEDDHEFSTAEFNKRLDGLIDSISSLPKEQLKLFLKHIHRAVER